MTVACRSTHLCDRSPATTSFGDRLQVEVILSIGVRMLDISLLGPVDVRVFGIAVPLSPLERNLLTVLALSKGMVVSTERMIDVLWGDRPPAAPRSRVQGLVSAVRRKVGEMLVTHHPGYRLDADGATLDLDECQDLVRQAQEAGTPNEAAKYLQQALDMWRGDPLNGITAPGVEYDRVRLTELRLGLQEQLFAARMELGHNAELIAELSAAVSAHPLREELAGQLMLALYRSNRQADALAAYQRLRERLADELGSDPCADLRELHAAILRGDPAPGWGDRHRRFTGRPQPPAETGAARAADPGEIRPAQLPAGVGHFTGRGRELSALTHAVGGPLEEPWVLVVSGAGGIGKTALVVQWAHSVADRYPDGQIFVDLHGQVPCESLSVATALGVAIGALGVAKRDIPETADERAALYRTLVHGRRVLIVADDAASLAQVRALVPPTPASQLVATSRRRLAALAAHHAVRSFHIDPLTPDVTTELLGRIVGRDRLREPDADRVVRWCGGWPLVTRLAGTLLVTRPWQSMASFASELEGLADLVLDDDPRSVRAALVSAYQALSPAAAHLFGRIGRNPSSLSVGHPTTTADRSVRRVRRLLDELVAAHLLVEVGDGRYRLHDVVRRFARQCGAELADRDAVDEWVRRPGVPVVDPSEHMADL
jgi:DNA-binding SARP family transcriptional activator